MLTPTKELISDLNKRIPSNAHLRGHDYSGALPFGHLSSWFTVIKSETDSTLVYGISLGAWHIFLKWSFRSLMRTLANINQTAGICENLLPWTLSIGLQESTEPRQRSL